MTALHDLPRVLREEADRCKAHAQCAVCQCFGCGEARAKRDAADRIERALAATVTCVVCEDTIPEVDTKGAGWKWQTCFDGEARWQCRTCMDHDREPQPW